MDLKNYPKCEAFLKSKVKGVLENIQKMMLGDNAEGLELPPIEQDYVDKYLESILNNNLPWLYTILDEQDILLLIDHRSDGFLYTIKSNNNVVKEGGGVFYYKTRAELEKVAFDECLKLLENKL